MAAIDEAAINELAAAIRFHDGSNTMGAGALAEVLVAIGVRGPAAITAALDGLDEVGGIEERAHDVFERSGSIDLTTAEVVELIVAEARRALLGTDTPPGAP